MKIVYQGKLPAETIHRGTCYSCKTIVEFARREGRVTRDQRDGDYVTVECPTCNTSIQSPL